MPKKDYLIAEYVTLPSEGKIYFGQAVNPQVQLRSMTTKNEIQRLAPSDLLYKNLCDVLDDCIVDDIGISAYDLCLGDFQYLLYKLRAITYGENIQLEATCPSCLAKHTIEVSLNDFLPINEMDNFEELHEIELPKTHQRVTLNIQTPRTLDQITLNAARIKQRRPGAPDPTLVTTIQACIDSIDGKKPDPLTFDSWVENLPMADTNKITLASQKLNDMVRVDTDIISICPTCKLEHTVRFKVTPEFFRPLN